jgi:hypothetical protein
MKQCNMVLGYLFLVTILFISGCASNKNYRDATGVLKTDTRSVSGVNK